MQASCRASTSMVTSSVAVTNFGQSKTLRRAASAGEVRLRLDIGREVVLTLTASTPAVSRAPRCRSGDCGPSVFETRAQVEMADRKRSGYSSRGGEQVSPLGPPQLHGEERPSPSPTRRMLTRAGRTGPASDAGRTVSDPSAAARVRVCRPAASGACRPRPPPAHAVPGREVGLHAQSSHPPPERVTGNPLRTPAAAGGADAAPGRTWNGGPASIPWP